MHPYKLVKDVRTAHETGNVDSVMDGNINPFLKGLFDDEWSNGQNHKFFVDNYPLNINLKH